MRKFYTGVVRHRKSILIFFIASVILCAVLKNFVSVNYDMNDSALKATFFIFYSG